MWRLSLVLGFIIAFALTRATFWLLRRHRARRDVEILLAATEDDVQVAIDLWWKAGRGDPKDIARWHVFRTAQLKKRGIDV